MEINYCKISKTHFIENVPTIGGGAENWVFHPKLVHPTC